MREREQIIELFNTSEFEQARKSVGDLYKVPRTGWLNHGIGKDKAETVGEHTDSMIALFESVIDEIDPDKEFDRNRMIRIIQIHDWAEGNPDVGDRVTVIYSGEKEKQLVAQKKSDELKAMESICSKLGNEGEDVMKLWLEFEEQSTPEGKLLKEMDKLQAVLKAYEYEQYGTDVRAREFIDNIKKRNQVTNSVLVEIMSEVESKCK
ncbi:MAG: HD domain-containing protein [Candidatus Magasanikbacteria bacterium]|jgi:putative hydrolases of HD superfamily|nr:HD domain-containing protein [Candidatus Magasanikbacteria bacterium]MBT4314943.1 HD domain-containing protein [Candidatus Magasanikbacteria bacterium]MBT4546899.1 HD domain-containing protein [Candidatus Magasanikbacteria bacterium]MBT6819187.1 HD domain-containing protein [Candidatus Magasanikbacteria bacterium]